MNHFVRSFANASLCNKLSRRDKDFHAFDAPTLRNNLRKCWMYHVRLEYIFKRYVEMCSYKLLAFGTF